MAHRRAFTLIEAITAMVIMGIAMPAMLAALSSAHRGRVAPVMASRARWLAVERLEDIIADRASPARGWEYVVPGNYGDEPSIPEVPGFSRTVQIDETGPDLATPGEGYKTITVTVAWVHGGDETRSVRLATVLTELPD